MSSGRKAYKTTKVSVNRSRDAIEELLQKYDVVACQHAIAFETGMIELRFVRRVDEVPRSVKITLDARGNPPQAYRALYWWLKSQFEALEFGLIKFEDIFLSYFEWQLSDGTMTTVGEVIKPTLGIPGSGLPLGDGKGGA